MGQERDRAASGTIGIMGGVRRAPHAGARDEVAIPMTAWVGELARLARVTRAIPPLLGGDRGSDGLHLSAWLRVRLAPKEE